MSLAPPYSFPRSPSEEPICLLPHELQVSRNLELADNWVSVSPLAVSKPYIKVYSNSNTPETIEIPTDDPLDDILAESRQEILEYSLCLTYETKSVLPKPSTTKTDQLIIRKRSRTVLEQANPRKLEHSSNVIGVTGINKTPTGNSFRVISPFSRKAKPVIHDMTPAEKVKNRESNLHKGEEDDDSVIDPLACHADNIMRMAMDSTMLGSFFNNSFSSTFSNLADDSVVGKVYPDILDCDKSISESAPKLQLARLRAQKIEISAEDLKEAVLDLIHD